MLVKNEIAFEGKHMMDLKKLEAEILPRYPQHKDLILTFVKRVRFSIILASILFTLVVIFGIGIKYFN